MDSNFRENFREAALLACIEAGAALTPNRLVIFQTLCAADKPISAYEVQAVLAGDGSRFNIATIYRVLDFWCNLGLVHKIASLNKFHACANPAEAHTHMVNVCTRCEAVLESCSKRMGLDLGASSQSLGLTIPASQHIEIPVICAECA